MVMTHNHNDNRFFGLIYGICATIVLIALSLFLGSCHALKNVKHDVKDSVVVKVHDSVIYKTVINTKDSVVIKDTAIGISSGSVGIILPFNSKADTTIRKGNSTLRRHIDNAGNEHIDCNTDSLTIVINDLQLIVRQKSVVADSLNNTIQSTILSHSDIQIKEVSQSWFGRTWAKVKNYFAWFGLLCLLHLIYKLYKLVRGRYFLK